MNDKNQNILTLAFAFLLIAMSVFVLRVAFLGQPLKVLATQHDIVFRLGEVNNERS